MGRLTGSYVKKFGLDLGDHGFHFGCWAGPEDETVAPVFVVRLVWVFETGQDLIDGDAWEVSGEELGFLLSIAVRSVVVVGGLDLLLPGG